MAFAFVASVATSFSVFCVVESSGLATGEGACILTGGELGMGVETLLLSVSSFSIICWRNFSSASMRGVLNLRAYGLGFGAGAGSGVGGNLRGGTNTFLGGGGGGGVSFCIGLMTGMLGVFVADTAAVSL